LEETNVKSTQTPRGRELGGQSKLALKCAGGNGKYHCLLQGGGKKKGGAISTERKKPGREKKEKENRNLSKH